MNTSDAQNFCLTETTEVTSPTEPLFLLPRAAFVNPLPFSDVCSSAFRLLRSFARLADFLGLFHKLDRKCTPIMLDERFPDWIEQPPLTISAILSICLKFQRSHPSRSLLQGRFHTPFFVSLNGIESDRYTSRCTRCSVSRLSI